MVPFEGMLETWNLHETSRLLHVDNYIRILNTVKPSNARLQAGSGCQLALPASGPSPALQPGYLSLDRLDSLVLLDVPVTLPGPALVLSLWNWFVLSDLAQPNYFL